MTWMRAGAVTAIFVLTGSASAQQQEGFSATDKLAPEFQLTPFYEAGLDYVSCSPFRVPIARLAAAQAVLGGGTSSTK